MNGNSVAIFYTAHYTKIMECDKTSRGRSFDFFKRRWINSIKNWRTEK
jgi:hypothetical protein